MKKTLIAFLILAGVASAAATYTWNQPYQDGTVSGWGTNTNWNFNDTGKPFDGHNAGAYYPAGSEDTAIFTHDVTWNESEINEAPIVRVDGCTFTVNAIGGNNFKKIRWNILNGGKVNVVSSSAIGMVNDLTLNFGNFNATNVGSYTITMGGAQSLWTKEKAITLSGTFDISDITQDYKLTLYSANRVISDDGASVYNIDGLVYEGGDAIATSQDAAEWMLNDAGTHEVKAWVSKTVGSVVLNCETRLIPEPTTATLSLLALAGLAARRRRASH